MFGIGNSNDTLMETLADDGNGSYAYIDELDDAQKLFVEDLTSTLQVIALDAKVQVDFNPDVVAYYHLIGYENRDVCRRLLLRNRLDFRTDAVYAGEIGAGHSATVQLRWEVPDSHLVTEIAPFPASSTLMSPSSIPVPSMLKIRRKLFGRWSLNYFRNQNVWNKLGRI